SQDQVELIHASLKAVPVASSALVCALSAPPAFTMSMRSACQAASPIVPVWPETVALAPVKEIVPKLASGSTPPDHGASMTHSAELRAAFAFCVVVKVHPPSASDIVSVKRPPE